jgi:hypothetical protein
MIIAAERQRDNTLFLTSMKLAQVSFAEIYIVDRISNLATDVTYPFSRINRHIFTAIIRNNLNKTICWFIQRLVAGIYIKVEAYSPIVKAYTNLTRGASESKSMKFVAWF